MLKGKAKPGEVDLGALINTTTKRFLTTFFFTTTGSFMFAYTIQFLIYVNGRKDHYGFMLTFSMLLIGCSATGTGWIVHDFFWQSQSKARKEEAEIDRKTKYRKGGLTSFPMVTSTVENTGNPMFNSRNNGSISINTQPQTPNGRGTNVNVFKSLQPPTTPTGPGRNSLKPPTPTSASAEYLRKQFTPNPGTPEPKKSQSVTNLRKGSLNQFANPSSVISKLKKREPQPETTFSIKGKELHNSTIEAQL